MPTEHLINPRLIKNKLQITEIPAAHLDILQAWRDSITNKAIFKQKETALHSHFIQNILIDVLGYQGFGGASWTLAQEQQIGAGSVDVALGQFSSDSAKILAPFELKGAKTKDLDAIMPGRHKSPVQQAWEYAMDAPGAAWVLVSNYLEIRLYAVGHGRQAYERWDLSKLTEPKEYARLQWLLSAKQLLSGKTAKILAQSAQLEKEITNQLYRDYKALREQLLQALKADNPEVSPLDCIRHAQTSLDRILFIAFAADRGLLPDRILAHAYEQRHPYFSHTVWDNFKGLFRAIDQGSAALKIPAYNGGLFEANPELDNLTVSDELCEAFKNLGEYDFASEVSVTVLGHIFEQSISDIEGLQAEARGENGDGAVSKRKQHGVVYTPDHITRFIVEHTLGGHLRAKFAELWDAAADKRKKNAAWKAKKDEIQFWRAYQHVLRATRVVDPACGSGAFLVAAFDYLHAEYTRVNDVLADLSGGSYDVFDLDKEILNRNLYGVDVNVESIEITRLSLWLKTAKRDKVLNSLDVNIQVGNSLIKDPAYTDKPFDWAQFSAAAQAKNRDLFHNGSTPDNTSGFDVVLGNPPYVRQELISSIKPYLAQHYQVYNGVVDLYAYFFELGLNILKPGGRLGFISSSTFFKTNSGKNLRQFLTQNASLENLVDFGDLQIFAGVTTYPAILTMRKTAPAAEHRLQMLVLGKQIPADSEKYFSEYAVPMSQANLDVSTWRLESNALLDLRRKISANKPTLKEVYGAPYRGVLTGLNEAFVIDKTTRDAFVKSEPKSAELLKPFLIGKEIKKWRVESRDLFCILIPKGWTKKHIETNDENQAWQWFYKTYPAIAKHLEPFTKKARKRTDKGDFWWELRACTYYGEFEKQKIIYGHFQDVPLFSIAEKSVYCNNKAYISANMGFYELGLLNSKLIWFSFSQQTTRMRGGFFEATTQNINNIPIPNATETQKQDIAKIAEACQAVAESRYQKQDAVRRRIPDLCPPEREAKLNAKLKNWWQLDFANFRAEIKKAFKQDIPLSERNEWEHWLNQERAEIAQLSAELAALEKALNEKVYALFELTEEEIRLVEENQ